jgi:hypothetical protein
MAGPSVSFAGSMADSLLQLKMMAEKKNKMCFNFMSGGLNEHKNTQTNDKSFLYLSFGCLIKFTL